MAGLEGAEARAALTVADFAGTLAVEATIHHLDMIACVPAAPGRRRTAWLSSGAPSTACSAFAPTPAGMTRPTRSRERAANRSPTADRSWLGGLADRFPLLG